MGSSKGRTKMSRTSFVKPVVVETEWLANQRDDEQIVIAEVDEDPDLSTISGTPSRPSRSVPASRHSISLVIWVPV